MTWYFAYKFPLKEVYIAYCIILKTIFRTDDRITGPLSCENSLVIDIEMLYGLEKRQNLEFLA